MNKIRHDVESCRCIFIVVLPVDTCPAHAVELDDGDSRAVGSGSACFAKGEGPESALGDGPADSSYTGSKAAGASADNEEIEESHFLR